MKFPFFYIGTYCGFLVLPFILPIDQSWRARAIPFARRHTAEIILLKEYRRRRYSYRHSGRALSAFQISQQHGRRSAMD